MPSLKTCRRTPSQCMSRSESGACWGRLDASNLGSPGLVGTGTARPRLHQPARSLHETLWCERPTRRLAERIGSPLAVAGGTVIHAHAIPADASATRTWNPLRQLLARANATRFSVGRGSASAIVLVLAITAIGAYIRLATLRSQSLWLDEIGQAVTARGSLPHLLEGVRSAAGAAPLDYLGTKLLTAIAGPSTTAVRAWPFLVGCLTLPLAFVVTWLLTRSRTAGLATTTLLALAPIHLFYSQEARFYALSSMATLTIATTYLQACRTTRPRAWAGFAAALAAGLLAYYYVALIALCALVFESIRWAGWRRKDVARFDRRIALFLMSGALAVLLFSPWAGFALPLQFGRSFYWSVPPFNAALWLDAIRHLLTLHGTSALTPNLPSTLVVAGMVGLASIGMVAEVRAGHYEVIPLAATVVLAFPLAWLASSRSGYQLAARQLVFVLPLILVLVGAGVAAVGRATSRLPGSIRRYRASRLAVVFAMVVLLAYGNVSGLRAVQDGQYLVKEDWRSATKFVASIMCADTTVYSNLDANYAYGIGYYDPAVELHTRWIYADMVEAAEVKFEAALGQRSIAPHDVLVILAFAGGANSPNVQGLGSLKTLLAADGWTLRTFTDQLLVYYRQQAAIGPRC